MSEVFQVIRPGETAEDGKTAITVYPVRYAEIRTFQKEVVKVCAGIYGLMQGNDPNLVSGAMLQTLLGMVGDELLTLLERCTVPSISEVNPPHWVLPEVFEVWFAQNFDSEAKVRPWVAAVEQAVRQITGKELQLWQTLKSSLSPADSTAATSTTASSTDTPTPDGPSASSAPTPEPAPGE